MKKITLSHLLGFEDFNKPFLNVDDLTIEDTWHLEKKCLSRLFPKLCRLTLGPYGDYSDVAEYLPNLHHLETKCGYWTDDIMVCYGNILNLNPNLRSLKIDINNCISEHLQSIECLEIQTISPRTCDNLIYLQNVTKFKIHYITDEPLPKIPFIFSKLKEIEIMISGWHPDINSILPFINENRLTEKLMLRGSYVFDVMLEELKTNKLQEKLPYLKHIICHHTMSGNRKILPEHLPYLNFLDSFSYCPMKIDDELLAACEKKWRVTKPQLECLVTLKRIETEANV